MNIQDNIHRTVVAGGTTIHVDSKHFTGGRLTALFGGIEVDLRRAVLAPEGATLSVHAVMGGVQVRVTESWRVVCEVEPVLGGVDAETAPDDKDGPCLRIV